MEGVPAPPVLGTKTIAMGFRWGSSQDGRWSTMGDRESPKNRFFFPFHMAEIHGLQNGGDPNHLHPLGWSSKKEMELGRRTWIRDTKG